MTRLIKTTILGGILFLVPIVIFVAIIGKALKLSSLIAAPLAERLFVDSAGGFAAVHILAVAILIAICFVAGLAARTTVAKKLVTSLETNVLDKIPAYELLKAKTQSRLSPEETEGLRPAITRFDDSWQLVFEIERLADGKVVVFLPGSPDPWSGSICVVTDDRVTPLDLTVNSAANLMKRLGRGATDTLQKAIAISQPLQ
jgi:uncharacterized membrane protein